MNIFTQQVFNILITPPGNLVYHLILAFAVVAGLQAALAGQKNSGFPYPGRILLGLGLILLAQLVLFFSSGLAWQQVADPQRFLPPLDRAVTVFSLVWIVWLWCFPTPSRLADSVTGVLSLAVVVLAAFTLSAWMLEPAGTAFNGSTFDWGWALFGIVESFLGMLILLIGRPTFWGSGLGALGLMLVGFVIHLLTVNPSGDFSGVIRLAQLCAFPLLPMVAQRIRQAPTKSETEPALPIQMRLNADPKMVQAWMQLAAESGMKAVSTAMAHAVAQTMLGDFCFLITSPDVFGRWAVQGGYDLVSEQPLPDMDPFEHEKIPNLAAALQRGRSIRLPSSAGVGAIDLKSIGEAVGLEDGGRLLAAPLISNGKVWGGIVLLSSYSPREWTAEEQSTLVAAAEPLMQVLLRAEAPASAPASELSRLNSDLRASREQVESLRKENTQLQSDLTSLNAQAEKHDADTELEGLLAIQAEAQDTINQLQAENRRLQGVLKAAEAHPQPSGEAQQMENELRTTLEEMARLQNALAKANAKLLEMQREQGSPAAVSQQAEMIASISQELRQPLTSIQGYSDLLLAEEAGALSERQTSYLDHIKSSIERMRSILGDLVRVSTMQDGVAPITPREVDFSAAVDGAVNANSSLLREKNISLQVELPDPMPHLHADPEALQQILADLLRNASSVSPADSAITLRICLEQNGADASLLRVQVGDMGGGIPDQDVERVFNPITQARTPMIEGVSDGGYGLAIARALVKAHGGEIWVENDPGQSAMFNVRLPLEPGDAADSSEIP